MDQSELITLYFGADMTEQQANDLADQVRQRYPDLEVEVIQGGQPHYQLLLSIE
jgi:dihydroxyacetone kinase-like predicted kinase